MTRYTTPIIDRAQIDLDTNTAKAFFNVLDWVRLYNNTLVTFNLVNVLSDAGLSFNTVPAFDITTIPTVGELNTLLGNIETLRLASGFTLPGMVEIKDDWAAGTSAAAPDYIDANDWERVVDIIFRATGNSVEYFVYSGVAAVGQPRFYQHRWRQYEWVEDDPAPVRRARTGVAITGAPLTRNNSFRRYA